MTATVVLDYNKFARQALNPPCHSFKTDPVFYRIHTPDRNFILYQLTVIPSVRNYRMLTPDWNAFLKPHSSSSGLSTKRCVVCLRTTVKQPRPCNVLCWLRAMKVIRCETSHWLSHFCTLLTRSSQQMLLLKLVYLVQKHQFVTTVATNSSITEYSNS